MAKRIENVDFVAGGCVPQVKSITTQKATNVFEGQLAGPLGSKLKGGEAIH